MSATVEAVLREMVRAEIRRLVRTDALVDVLDEDPDADAELRARARAQAARMRRVGGGR